MNDRARPEDVFSKRAGYYVTSAAHTDPEVLANVVRMARPKLTDMGLDIGTGTGHTALALAPHVKCMVGLDVTEKMLLEARRLAIKKGIFNVQFRLGDAMALPYPDGSFEIVTCRRAAHHFTDIRKAIAEMHRVLRPGSRLVIDDRSVPDDDEADEAMNHLDVLHDPSHVREYRLTEWEEMLSAAGFDIDEASRYQRHQSMARFTEGLEASVAQDMRDYLESCSAACKKALNYDMTDGEAHVDHFFVMLAAVKRP
jgi:ubiquinone/menaquinone biosynthesis C-methylase UbiE